MAAEDPVLSAMEMDAGDKKEVATLGDLIQNGDHSDDKNEVSEEGFDADATAGKCKGEQIVVEPQEGEIAVFEERVESGVGSLVEKKYADGKRSRRLVVQSKQDGESLSNNGALVCPILEENGKLCSTERKENGSSREETEKYEEDGQEEEDEDGMVEEQDSDPLIEKSPGHRSSSQKSSREEEEGVKEDAVAQKQPSTDDGTTDLEKLVLADKEGRSSNGSDEEEISMEAPRTAHELKELPPVPKIDAVLEPHQTPQPVGTISSVVNKQVIVEATDHKLVLNKGSILWLTEQRIPLGIVDEVLGPVKKPYYVVRYNEVVDIPEGATEGKDVAFVPELAKFVQDNPELWKKGYDASGEHDEEVSETDEFSDDEKEEEMRRVVKQGHLVQGVGNSGRRGGQGGRVGGVGDRSRGRRGRGRGGRGRGRDFRSESPEMVPPVVHLHMQSDGTETAVQQIANMGLQRQNFQASPIHHADRGPRYDQQPRQPFQPSPERQDSWNRNTHPESRPLVVHYSDRQPVPCQSPQSPHHNFVPGMRPLQGPPSPQWGPPVHHIQGPQVYQSYPAPYLASTVRLPSGPDTTPCLQSGRGGFQYPGHMFQTGVGLGPQTPYPHTPQMNMYRPIPSQPTGTGVFIPPTPYTRISQSSSQQVHSDHLRGRGTAVNVQVTGIPCYHTPAPVYLQQGVVPHLGGSAPGPSSSYAYWSNNSSR